MKGCLRTAISIALLVLFVISVTGCTKQGSTNETVSQSTSQAISDTDATVAETTEPYLVTYYVPGAENPDDKLVFSEISKKMKADGLNLEFERRYITWDQYWTKIPVMIVSGEAFDLFTLAIDALWFTKVYADGGLADITQYLDEDGPALKKYIPQWQWEDATIDGKVVAIPAYWVNSTPDMCMARLDILRQYGMEVAKTPEEMLDQLTEIKKSWKGPGKLILPTRTDVVAFQSSLHRACDDWPFLVKEYDLIYLNDNGTVMNWVETDAFKKESDFYREAARRDLLASDIMQQPVNELINQVNSGNWVYYTGGVFDVTPLKNNWPDIKPEDLQAFFFRPEKPLIFHSSFQNCNGVSITSKNPRAAVQFMNWMYSSQENYDLYMYGIKDKHFKDMGKGLLETIPGPNNQYMYGGVDWMTGNLQWERVRFDMVPSGREIGWSGKTKIEARLISRFKFDPTSVSTQYNDMRTIYKSDIKPIYFGVFDYDEKIEEVLAKLKAAGSDDVIAEYKKQWDSYRSKMNK